LIDGGGGHAVGTNDGVAVTCKIQMDLDNWG